MGNDAPFAWLTPKLAVTFMAPFGPAMTAFSSATRSRSASLHAPSESEPGRMTMNSSPP